MSRRSSSDYPIPLYVREEIRRAREFPELVRREEELEALEEKRREARAASRRRRFLTADVEYEPNAASPAEPQERSW